MDPSVITIVLADDHTLVRQGLRALLSAESDFRVVDEAADGLQAMEAVRRLKPEVLVLDLMLPGLNGLEVARQVHRHAPKTRIVILSMHSNEAYVLEALRNGARAYVLKDATGAELVRAIREVVAGRRYLSPPLSERAIAAYVEKTAAADTSAYPLLTSRERQVLQLAAEGLSNTEIAARLSISPRTVETHRAHLMRKLGLKSQTDLIRYALKRGFLPPES